MSTPEERLIAEEVAESAHDASTTHRSPRISRDDVFRVADALLVEGNRPTIDRVRMRLGRGSPNTINEHLDAWWTRLGSRLRDLPGREFPQLPERVNQAVQHLWNEALEGAHAALRGTQVQREQEHLLREQALAKWEQQLTAREQAAEGRQAALEESLQMAREQLAVVNRTVATLEATLLERDIQQEESRSRIEALEADCAELEEKIEAQASSHQAERVHLQEQHAAAESRWLMEVDRGRQVLKDGQKEHERVLREQRQDVIGLTTERERLRRELAEAHGELKVAAAVRQQLEERLRAAESEPTVQQRKFRRRSPSTSKPVRR
jgi:hypothetical protein